MEPTILYVPQLHCMSQIFFFYGFQTIDLYQLNLLDDAEQKLYI